MTLWEFLTSLFTKAGDIPLEGIAGLKDVLWSVACSSWTFGWCLLSLKEFFHPSLFIDFYFKAGRGDSHV